MDISDLENQVALLQCIGYTLNVDEKLKLKLAHIDLLERYPDLDQVKFWGKVEGITKNYYIMQGLQYSGSYQFPRKSYFWALHDFSFKEFPDLLLQHQGLADKNNILFSGDPNKIVVNLEGDSEEQPPESNQNPDEPKQKKPEDDEDEQLKKVPKKNFTQLHRLSCVVRAIDNDAFCLPRGSVRITPDHELHPNNNFYGLSLSNALNMNSWHHFRSPQTQQAQKNINDDMVVFGSNFLDTLENDQPKGVWSIQLDCQRRNVTVRNMFWPGCYAFHKLNSGIHGCAYFGDGIKNIDLPFMI